MEKLRVIPRAVDAERFDPSRIDPQAKTDALQLSEKERIKLHEGDTIRWTDTDKARDLLLAGKTAEAAKLLTDTAHKQAAETLEFLRSLK